MDREEKVSSGANEVVQQSNVLKCEELQQLPLKQSEAKINDLVDFYNDQQNRLEFK